MRAATKVLAVVLVAAGLTGGWPAAASAHAALRGSNPAAGARLGSAPGAVSVRFNEPVEAGLGALRVYGPGGGRVDTGGTARGQGGPATVAVRLRRGLPRGTYTVAWRVTSSDSHVVSGAFAFGVGPAGAAGASLRPAAVAGAGGSGSGAGDRAVGVLAGVARWVAFGGFALLVGAGAFVAFCWRAGSRRLAVRRIALIGWSALIVATVVALALQGPHATGRGLGSVADPDVWRATAATRLGRALTVRLLLLAAARWYLSWLFSRAVAAARAERRALRWSGLALAAGLAASVSAAGHAGVGRQVALAFPADLAHLLAMGAWLGGLVVLVSVLRGPVPDRPDRAAVDRFSRLAFWSVAVLATTGLYQTWRQVGSVGALTGTGYGRLVLAKAAGFTVLLALGARARRVLAGRRADVPPRLRSGVLAEVTVGAAVLAATAVLVNVAPGREVGTPVTASAAVAHVGHGGHVHASLVTRTVAFGPGTVTAVVDPARPGWNTITLTVRDAVPPVEITAAFTLARPAVGPMAVTLAGAGPGRYLGAGVFLPLAGDWRLTAVLRTSEIDETTVTVPVALSQ